MLVLNIKSRFRSKILIFNTRVYLFMSNCAQYSNPCVKDIILHIFFLIVLFGNLKSFLVYGEFRYLYGPQQRMGLLVNFPILEIIIACLAAAIFDPVNDMEATFHPPYLLTESGNLSENE